MGKKNNKQKELNNARIAEGLEVLREMHPLLKRLLGSISDDCFVDWYVFLLHNASRLEDVPSDDEIRKGVKSLARAILCELNGRYHEILEQKQ